MLGVVFAAAFMASRALADPSVAQNAQIVFLGENHDNPAHHVTQEAWVRALEPKALVFEMLTPDQALRVTPQNRSNATLLSEILEWETSGWPDFAMYYPIIAAVPEAIVFGAGIPPERVRGLMQDDLAAVAGDRLTAAFGLDIALPSDEQVARETLQKEAHCDALPDTMLPTMVSVQRLRDAALADAALAAFEKTGGPIVVITGNGHARTDWGASALVRYAAADVTVFALGQSEAGQMPEGRFDMVVDGPAFDRGDPCAAFR